MFTYGKSKLRRKTADRRIKAFTGLAAATIAFAPVVAAYAQTGGATGVSGDSTAATSTSTAPAQGGATGVSSDDTAASSPTTTNSSTTSTGQSGVSSTSTTGTGMNDQTGANATVSTGANDQTGMNGQTGASATAGTGINGQTGASATAGTGMNGQTGMNGMNGMNSTLPNNGAGAMSSGTSTMPGNGATGTMTPGMNSGVGYGATTYGNGGGMINGTGAMGEVNTTGANGMTYSSMPHIDYTVLADPRLNYFDIRRAHAYGLTNQDIGCAYTLARLTDRSMTEVLNRIEDGATFPALAESWGVPLQDVYKPLWDRDRIHEYMVAWNHTGVGALRKKEWNNWPGWVDWQANGTSSADAAIDNGTGAPGTESPSAFSSQTSISSESSTTTASLPNTATSGQTIDDVIRSDGRFTQLSSALTAAGLDSYLSNNGPFTFFAPTDAAFAKLPQGQLTALMQDPTDLSKVLQYDLVGQNLQQSDMTGMTTQSLSSIEGSQLNMVNSNGVITVNGANVTGTAIPASNGTIYAIDTVLMPPDVNLNGAMSPATPATPAPTAGQ